MSQSLSRSVRRDMRKELVRLRLEMHRQQLHYHAQPLTNPLQQLRQGNPGNVKTPLMVAAGVLLTLFGGRLGTFGKLARGALLLYPMVRSLQNQKNNPLELHR